MKLIKQNQILDRRFRSKHCENFFFRPAAAPPEPASQEWRPADKQFSHPTGFQVGNGWEASAPHPPGYMLAGPYNQKLAAGRYVVSWTLLITPEGCDATDQDVLVLEVAASAPPDRNEEVTVLSQKTVRESEWRARNFHQTFSLDFEVPLAMAHRKNIEYRVRWLGVCAVQLINVKRAPSVLAPVQK